jgi:DNA ligase D-like protein (predicted ligase)
MSGCHPSRGRALLAVSIDRSRNPFRFPPSGSRSLTRIHRSDDRSAPALYNPSMAPPKWIRPQLSRLATKAPSGLQWIHEIKLDGYRMAARIADGAVQLLTRSGLDWTDKYPSTAAALTKLKVRSAYLDGELCGVRPDGVTSFELMQQASDSGGAGLTYFVFDLLELDGEDLMSLPLIDRKKRLAVLLKTSPPGVMFNDHETGDGEAFRRAACNHSLEGTVSKRADRPYLPDDRGASVKTKCLNRAEFVVVGWTDPEGSRPFLGALLLGYFDNEGRLLYAGRVGTGMSQKTLAAPSPAEAARHPCDAARGLAAEGDALRRQACAVARALGPAGAGREITYLSWAEDGLLRHTVFVVHAKTNRRARSGARSPREYAKRLPCVAAWSISTRPAIRLLPRSAF